jgi:hypothetical protein
LQIDEHQVRLASNGGSHRIGISGLDCAYIMAHHREHSASSMPIMALSSTTRIRSAFIVFPSCAAFVDPDFDLIVHEVAVLIEPDRNFAALHAFVLVQRFLYWSRD